MKKNLISFAAIPMPVGGLAQAAGIRITPVLNNR
jgi:hypothetical protein